MGKLPLKSCTALCPGRRYRQTIAVPPAKVGQVVHVIRKIRVEFPATRLHSRGRFAHCRVILEQSRAVDHEALNKCADRLDLSVPQLPS